MKYAARLFYNEAQWKKPSNSDRYARRGKGFGICVQRSNYHYGLEEWLGNKIPRELKLGYLECYRQIKYDDLADMKLFTRKTNGYYYHIGNIYGVHQLQGKDISAIRKQLLASGWKDEIVNNFISLGEKRNFQNHREYQLNWGSHTVIRNNVNIPGFSFNIRYNKLELFKERDHTLIPQKSIQGRHRLSRRYNCTF